MYKSVPYFRHHGPEYPDTESSVYTGESGDYEEEEEEGRSETTETESDANSSYRQSERPTTEYTGHNETRQSYLSHFHPQNPLSDPQSPQIPSYAN